MEKGQGVPGDLMRRESGLEEDWNMEVDEEVDNRKKLDEQRKRLQKEFGGSDKFSDMDQMFRDGQDEKWKEELQEIEKKRSELLLEHQKMQKRSQKTQSLQKKKKEFSRGRLCL